MKRWLKRFWLRYVYYCKEHWFIASSIVLTVFWLLWQVISLLGPLLEIAVAIF
jgi:hypothetical protein